MAEKQTTEKQSTFKELVLPVIVLVVICLICSALLAVLNDITAPIIAENTQAETLAAYVSVLPEGTTTDSMTAIDGLTTASVEGAVKTANGDVAVKAAASGYSGKDVTVYTGYTWEELLAMQQPEVDRLLAQTDILIDGPFRAEEKDLTLRFRGSRNQRVIDLNRTRLAGTIVLDCE